MRITRPQTTKHKTGTAASHNRAGLSKAEQNRRLRIAMGELVLPLAGRAAWDGRGNAQ